MKYFVSSDIHGFYDIWMRELAAKGFDKDNPEHAIVVLGDLLDRGDQPVECLQFVMSLPAYRRILIRGNHEDLLQIALHRGNFQAHDVHNGTDLTVAQIAKFNYGREALMNGNYSKLVFEGARTCKLLCDYFESLFDYAEIGDNVFVHGWIPCICYTPYGKYDGPYYPFDNWRDAPQTDWYNARWINGMDAWSNGGKIEGKTVWCGHFHTSWGHSKLHKEGLEFPNMRSTNPEHRVAHFSTFVDDGIRALDACTAFSHKINVEVIDY